MGLWSDMKGAFKSSYSDGQGAVRDGVSDLLNSSGSGKVAEGLEQAAGGLGKATGFAMETTRPVRWFAGKAVKWGLGAAVVGGVAAWAVSKRNESAQESRAAGREQQFAALEAENRALDQAIAAQAAGPQVGDRTLMGLEPVEGQHVAALGRSGRMTAVERATQPQLTALSEQPAALGA